jgi:biofilm protein TabA
MRPGRMLDSAGAAAKTAKSSGEAEGMSGQVVFKKLTDWKKHYQGAAWEKAFSALEKITPDTPDGVIKVQRDDIRVIVMSYRTKPADDAVIESHRDFIDIQLMITGEETFRWWPVAVLEVSEPYNPEKDIVFYKHGPTPAGAFAARPGWFAVFNPGDAHSTQIFAKGSNSSKPCRKAVAKVRASLAAQ